MGLHSKLSRSLYSSRASGHVRNSWHQWDSTSDPDDKEEVRSTPCIGISSFDNAGHCNSIHIPSQSIPCLAVFGDFHMQWENRSEHLLSHSLASRSQWCWLLLEMTAAHDQLRSCKPFHAVALLQVHLDVCCELTTAQDNLSGRMPCQWHRYCASDVGKVGCVI